MFQNTLKTVDRFTGMLLCYPQGGLNRLIVTNQTIIDTKDLIKISLKRNLELKYILRLEIGDWRTAIEPWWDYDIISLWYWVWHRLTRVYLDLGANYSSVVCCLHYGRWNFFIPQIGLWALYTSLNACNGWIRAKLTMKWLICDRKIWKCLDSGDTVNKPKCMH